MEVGLQFIFQNTHEGLSDAEMMRGETEICLLAEEVGMDFVLLPEHHFDPDYSMMPDNMQWLSYLAGKTSRIKLGTGAIILPWHLNPTRVAEKIAMLQIVLGDRFMLGFGRALGETMAVTMVIGNNPQVSASLFAPQYTMAAVIANEFTEATDALYLSALDVSTERFRFDVQLLSGGAYPGTNATTYANRGPLNAAGASTTWATRTGVTARKYFATGGTRYPNATPKTIARRIQRVR